MLAPQAKLSPSDQNECILGITMLAYIEMGQDQINLKFKAFGIQNWPTENIN